MALARLVFVILKIIDAYSLILAVYALLSWFPRAYYSKITQIVTALSEPFVAYFRQFKIGVISFSVPIALCFLQFVKYGIVAIYQILR